MKREKVIIMGAAGRDFHNFLTYYKNRESAEVVCFTAQQIPGIAGRTFPKELSGKLYPNGVPIHAEEELEALIEKHQAETCVLSYSDLSNQTVMDLAARVVSAGSSFKLLCPKDTMVKSNKPVIAITAVRTGCGKSQVSRYVNRVMKAKGVKTCAIRHPMPYGDLVQQSVQRFHSLKCLDDHKVTVEEREEYEMHIKAGTLVWAGVDYAEILKRAEKEADVIIWDGGNNDFPFYKPDLHITIADPLRVGHELTYFPGCVNIRIADIVAVNKCNSASQVDIARIYTNIKSVNPNAVIVQCDSSTIPCKPELIKGKKVLVVEDGPTSTHGELSFGAATVASNIYGACERVDPKPYLVGILKKVMADYPHIDRALPAVGYSKQQLSDLEATINAVECDSVVLGTPAALSELINIKKPFTVVKYEQTDRPGQPKLSDHIEAFIKKHFNK